MYLWTRARALPVLAGGLLCTLTFELLARDTLVSLPTLGSDAGRPLILFAPLLTCVALAHCLDSALQAAERTATRRIATLDQGLTLLTGAVSVLTAWLLSVLTAAPSLATAGRNTLFLAGLMLCVRALAGHQFAAITPAAWVITMTLIGADPAGHDRPWTVVLAPADHPQTWIVAAGVFLLGVATVPARPCFTDSAT